MYIYPHDQASEGAKVLAEALNARRIRRAKSVFKGSPDKIVINWGGRAVSDEVAKCRVINPPAVVATCSNKLEFFNQLNGTDTRHVPFTTDVEQVKQWLSEGRTVCARQTVTGSGGEGLVLFDGMNSKTIPEAPLYTMYVKKKDEYRVHVFRGEIIDVQRKALKLVPASERGGKEKIRGIQQHYYDDNGRYCTNPEYTKLMETLVPPMIDGQDHRIRNLANGYIFMRNEITPPQDVLDQAKSVFNVVPLDFGAVDVIWNEKAKKAFVLEVNTAPGLEGQTVTSYSDAFASMEK